MHHESIESETNYSRGRRSSRDFELDGDLSGVDGPDGSAQFGVSSLYAVDIARGAGIEYGGGAVGRHSHRAW